MRMREKPGGLPAADPRMIVSESEVGAELHHAAVLDQRGLEPQRAVVEVLAFEWRCRSGGCRG